MIKTHTTLSAGVIEYANYISAERGKTLPTRIPVGRG